MEDAKKIGLRKARLTDTKFLWYLRNQKAVRENSFNPHKVLLKDHKDWLGKALKDKDRYLYVIENHNKPIGQIRFDINGKGACVNISISSSSCNKGIGSLILKKASKNFLSKDRSINSVAAYIKIRNQRSLKAFKSRL